MQFPKKKNKVTKKQTFQGYSGQAHRQKPYNH